MAAGNTWGLLFLIILLSAGLVDIPRNLWLSANQEVVLNHLRFKICTVNRKLQAAREELTKNLKVSMFFTLFLTVPWLTYLPLLFLFSCFVPAANPQA
jgi:hypothetical protein